MLSDPEFYGLNYDAYQMLTFDLEDYRNKMKKTDNSEAILMEKVLYDLENSKSSGPIIPDSEELPFDMVGFLKEFNEKSQNKEEIGGITKEITEEITEENLTEKNREKQEF